MSQSSLKKIIFIAILLQQKNHDPHRVDELYKHLSLNRSVSTAISIGHGGTLASYYPTAPSHAFPPPSGCAGPGAREFDWESQLRTYWDKAGDDCVVRQCTGEFAYGHEYTGLSGRLVVTPLTDRSAPRPPPKALMPSPTPFQQPRSPLSATHQTHLPLSPAISLTDRSAPRPSHTTTPPPSPTVSAPPPLLHRPVHPLTIPPFSRTAFGS